LYDAQLKEMDNLWELKFGGCAWNCIGRNVSWIEMQNVILKLAGHFIVEVSHPEKK
jgi:hypothetical protein